jgi:hypothetical protein
MRRITSHHLTIANRCEPGGRRWRFTSPRLALRLKAWADQRYSSSKNRRTNGECDYFFAPELAPGFPFKNEGDGAEGFGFSALGFFGSRLLRF